MSDLSEKINNEFSYKNLVDVQQVQILIRMFFKKHSDMVNSGCMAA